MEGFEVAADRDALGEESTLVEFQHRNALHRVLGPILGSEVFAGADVDGHTLDVDALFLHEDSDAAGVGGFGFVKPQGATSCADHRG